VGHRSIGVLRPGGLLVTIIDRADAGQRAAVLDAGRRFAGISVEPDYAGLEALAGLADAGLLRPHVEHAIPLEDAAKAHELIESGSTRGKIVLTV
ncbi:MAG: zinc-binding dehydrogenase, partial [Catenulispora sp.]